MGAGNDALDQRIELLARKPGALDHAAALLRLCKVGNGRVHVIVEGEQIDAAFRQPFADFGLGVEIVGLVAQMEAGIRGKLRPHRFDRVEQSLAHCRRCAGPAPTTRSWRETRW